MKKLVKKELITLLLASTLCFLIVNEFFSIPLLSNSRCGKVRGVACAIEFCFCGCFCPNAVECCCEYYEHSPRFIGCWCFCLDSNDQVCSEENRVCDRAK